MVISEPPFKSSFTQALLERVRIVSPTRSTVPTFTSSRTLPSAAMYWQGPRIALTFAVCLGGVVAITNADSNTNAAAAATAHFHGRKTGVITLAVWGLC